MTTQTSLSAATRAQRDESVRNSSFQPPAPSFQKLIANLELEFRLTYRKISSLRISNRKFFAIFHLTAQLCRRPSSSSLPASSLEVAVPSISNPGHRPIPLACHESRRPQPHPCKPFAPLVNGRKTKSVPLAQPHPRNRLAALIQFLRATDRGSRATEILIYGPAIRNRRNPFKNNILKISNRR
jgi:hypothetical protein